MRVKHFNLSIVGMHMSIREYLGYFQVPSFHEGACYVWCPSTCIVQPVVVSRQAVAASSGVYINCKAGRCFELAYQMAQV